MRLAYYAGASTAAAAACLLKAFHQRPNFYSATVYLSQSNACLLILTNLCLVTACSFMYGLQRLLYGPLRPIEIEQLSEKAWYAVLDTLLAMPSFREEVGGWLLTMFVLLLAGKVWGWIGEGRVDVLEQQPPANPRLFHMRLATSLLVSVAFDVWMLNYCVDTVMADPRPGMMVIFTFEFAVLSVFSTFTLARYGLSLIQSRIEKKQMVEAIEARKSEIRAERAQARQNETVEGRPAPASPPDDEPIEVDENEMDVPGWEEKRRYLFALEVFTDFIKLMIYIVFFTVSITFNGLPMHIMRDVYMTFASFSKRVSDYVAYRKATSDMNTRYPDATTEEIRGDACIVCRESMVAWEQPAADTDAQPAGEQSPAAPAPQVRRDEGLRAKKLPCNHILHLRCLKAWLERQQVCPTCRRPVVTQPDTTQPGQPGAPGAALGQPGQPRPAGQNRARIFNLGPVRIGFLNGPGDQMQNIINQMRNPQAQAQAQAAAAGQPGAALPVAQQQGPNHLGLQVPYLNAPAPGQQGVAVTGLRAAVPTQIQMLQLEQRLMIEAHNLGIEQQQLATLRMMEGELARLRANHLPTNQPISTATAAQRQAQGLAGQSPFHQAPFSTPAASEMLQGNAQQQIGSGHESLPQGMVLPEGWTVMPLHRNGVAGGVPGINVQAPPVDVPAGTAQPPIQTTTNGATSGPTAQTATSTAPRELQGQAAGPTDESGSPLFIPTTPQPANSSADETPAAGSAPTSTTSQQASAQPQPSQQQTPAPAQSENKAPWATNNDGGWSFVKQNGDSAANGQRSASFEQAPVQDESDASAANAAPTESGVVQQEYSGKGKGKAVEVEDVPDIDQS